MNSLLANDRWEAPTLFMGQRRRLRELALGDRQSGMRSTSDRKNFDEAFTKNFKNRESITCQPVHRTTKGAVSFKLFVDDQAEEKKIVLSEDSDSENEPELESSLH